MEYQRLGDVESRFADIIRECEPLSSAELARARGTSRLKKTDHIHRPAAAVRQRPVPQRQRNRHLAHLAQRFLRPPKRAVPQRNV